MQLMFTVHVQVFSHGSCIFPGKLPGPWYWLPKSLSENTATIVPRIKHIYMHPYGIWADLLFFWDDMSPETIWQTWYDPGSGVTRRTGWNQCALLLEKSVSRVLKEPMYNYITMSNCRKYNDTVKALVDPGSKVPTTVSWNNECIQCRFWCS